MANIDDAYTIDKLSFDDNLLVTAGIIDPTIGAGYEAPTGSIFIRTNGTMYQKTNTADVDWTQFGSNGGNLDELVKISSNDTTGGYLNGKLVVGTSLTLTENNDGVIETLTIDTSIPLNDLANEIDAIELASGGIFDANGNFGSLAVDSVLTTVTSPLNLLDALSQMETTITGTTLSLDNLTDVTLGALADGQTLVYDSTLGHWKNILTTVTTPGTGRLLQVKFDRIPVLSGTVLIPLTALDPTVTEGVPLWSEVITPAEITSNMRISTSCTCSGSSNSTEMIFTFFRDSICIGVGLINMSARNAGHPFTIMLYDTPATLTSVTYSCRVGKTTGNTWYVNRLDDITLLNGQLANQAYTVEEIGVN